MGGKAADPNKAAMKQQEAQMERLDAIDLPQLQKYLLDSPELVGLLEAEGIDPSKMGDITEDAGLRENQLAALQGLRDQSEQGLTAQDKYQMEQMLGDVSANERASQAQIEDQMARRGMQSSGAALMAQQQNKQSGANQARERAMQMAAQAQQNKMGALAQLGQQSGQMAGQDFNRKAQVASAQDAISRANAMNRQGVNAQNLSARQQIANQGTNIGNQNKQIGNQIDQQNFNNAIAKASGQGNVANAMSNIAGNTPQQPSTMQKMAGGAATGAAIGGPWGAAAGAGVGLLMADGGIARQQKEQDDADKQHARFKKNYMKRVHQELEGGVPKTEPVHAQDGAMMNNEMFNFRDMQNDLIKSGRGEQTKGIATLGRGNDLTSADIQTNEQAQAALPEQGSGIDADKMAAGLGALSKLLGNGQQQQRKQLNLGAFQMQRPENALGSYQPFADGGIPRYEGVEKEDKKYGSLDDYNRHGLDNIYSRKEGMNREIAADRNVMLRKILEDRTPESIRNDRFADRVNLTGDEELLLLQEILKNNPEGSKKHNFYKEQIIDNVEKGEKYEDGGIPMYASDGMGDIVDSGMDSYADDRVDAKINDGEAILNVPQQQRFMDLVRGKISVDELGDDDIVEGVPSDYRDELHDKIEGNDSSGSSDKVAGLEKLLEMLGRS